MHMEEVCRNCLNAYNVSYSTKVMCCNKDFANQPDFDHSDVQPNETCGTLTPRRSSQPKLVFGAPVQLSLFPDFI